MSFLLGVDIGTQGAKALLVNTDGEPVAAGYQEYFGCEVSIADYATVGQKIPAKKWSRR